MDMSQVSMCGGYYPECNWKDRWDALAVRLQKVLCSMAHVRSPNVALVKDSLTAGCAPTYLVISCNRHLAIRSMAIAGGV